MQTVRPQRGVPIYFDDYDVFNSPLSDFKRDVSAAGLGSRVTYLDRGETYHFEPPLIDTEAEGIAYS